MKDEEMAEEYAEEKVSNLDECRTKDLMRSVCKDGFLAGLKAGRPQWHYVKDGDLPKHDHEVLCILWGDTREIGYYKNEVWYFENFSADNEDVDYWQEIIPPKEIE